MRKKLFQIGLLSLVGMAGLLPGLAEAKRSFLVAPWKIEFNMERPLTQTVIVTNTGDEPIRLTVEPTFFRVDDRSLNLGQYLHDKVADTENLVEQVTISPRTLRLKPGQRRDIRVRIRPQAGQADGEYRAHLMVRMKEVAHVLESPVAPDAAGGGMNMKLNIKLETAVAVYGQKGTPAPAVRLTCERAASGYRLHLVNDTVWRYYGELTLPGEAPQTLVMMRETERNLPVASSGPVTLSAGEQHQQVHCR